MRQLTRLGLLWLALLTGACEAERPSDEELIRQFEDHATQYAEIVAMLAEDQKVGTIGSGFLFEADRPFLDASVAQLGISQERLAEYKRLLAQVGVIRLDRHEQEAISFMKWASGFAGNTHHKGIAWRASPPQAGVYGRLLHIRGNWYLYDD